MSHINKLSFRVRLFFICCLVLLALPLASTAQWIKTTTYDAGPGEEGEGAVPAGIVTGPDGALWFTGACHGFGDFAFCDDAIGRMTTGGTVTLYALPTASADSTSIAVGADGAMWFTEAIGNKIGRITTSAVIQEYPAHGSPFRIVAGPDSALWFTENLGNKIGRMTTSGALTEFPIPTASSEPWGIAAGSDGALWFIETYGHKIGRVTTSGVFTEYPAPNSVSGAIAGGPDGALWFTGASDVTFAGIIGRITTSGVITEYPVPPHNSQAESVLTGITAGPDGALWFSDPDLNGVYNFIGRVTTTGQLTEFPSPPLGSLGDQTAITIGPDGAMWYTDGLQNIVRAPACGVGLSLSYAPSTLTVNFDLGVLIPPGATATWTTWLITNRITKLHSMSGGSVVPTEILTYPLHNIPSQGNIGVLSTVNIASQGPLCSDLQFVNTNGAGPGMEQLWQLIKSSGILPYVP